MVPMGSIDEETVRWDFFILSSEKKKAFLINKCTIVKYRN